MTVSPTARPNLTKLLVAYGRQNCPGFAFTSIQVNKNYRSALHVDRNNLGKSMIVGLGDYSKGELSRRRDCHSAASPSPVSRCFNREGEGDVSRMTVSPTAR